MKVLLVIPPESDPNTLLRDYNETLGASYLATYARHRGFTCDVVDPQLQNLDMAQTLSVIEAYGPDVVGLTAPYATSLLSAVKVAQRLRTAGFDGKIIVGGHSATFCWQKLLENHRQIDAVCLGEGEETFAEFVGAVRDGRPWSQVSGLAFLDGNAPVATAHRPLLDIDRIPPPDRDEISTRGQPVSIAFNQRSDSVLAFSVSTSRGCPFSCSFCSVASFYRPQSGPSWRGRSAVGVVEEWRK